MFELWMMMKRWKQSIDAALVSAARLQFNLTHVFHIQVARNLKLIRSLMG